MPIARLPLAFSIESRTASLDKDSKLVNAMVETIGEGEYNVVKRPGLVEETNTGDAIPAEQGRGIFSWNDRIIAGVGTDLFSIVGTDGAGVVDNLGTLTGTAQNPLSFVETANDTYLAFHDGSYLYTLPSATPTVFTNNTGGTAVLSATVSTPGGRYTTAPTVTFAGTGAPEATGTAVLYNNQVSSITIDTPGTYTAGTVPTITITTPPTGTTATATYSNVSHTTTLTSGGSGYLVAPSAVYSNIYETVPTYTNINSSGVVTSIQQPVISLVFTHTITIDPPPNTTAIATANMNATINGPWAPGIQYLDGYVYVMKSTTGAIYGSASEDPTTWTALNFISAASDPDEGVALAKHLNYLVAFGQWSTEFFYNAGTPGTGSPLANNQSAKLEIGCANGYSVANAEQTLIWVGNSLTDGKSVFMLQGLSPVRVSNKYIDKYLNASPMTAVDSVRALCFKIAGHTLYCLTLDDISKTFVYDLDEKKWYTWTSQTGDTTGTDGTETYWKMTSYTGNTEYNPAIYLQGDHDGKIYKLDMDYYDDAGDKIYFRAVSPITDSGTTKRKFYRRVEVVGDKVTGDLKIRHSSDDYQTWSTYRTVTLANLRPILWQNGQARRRAWEVFSSDSIPIRLRALEMEFDIGETGGGQEG